MGAEPGQFWESEGKDGAGRTDGGSETVAGGGRGGAGSP